MDLPLTQTVFEQYYGLTLSWLIAGTILFLPALILVVLIWGIINYLLRDPVGKIIFKGLVITTLVAVLTAVLFTAALHIPCELTEKLTGWFISHSKMLIRSMMLLVFADCIILFILPSLFMKGLENKIYKKLQSTSPADKNNREKAKDSADQTAGFCYITAILLLIFLLSVGIILP